MTTLAAALRSVGWTVRRAAPTEVVPPPQGEAWVVAGRVRSVMGEPIVGLWAVDLIAEAEVTLEVRTGARVYRRAVRGFEKPPDNLVCFTGCAESGLKAAMAKAVRDAALALIGLNERVPPAVLEPAPALLLLHFEAAPE